MTSAILSNLSTIPPINFSHNVTAAITVVAVAAVASVDAGDSGGGGGRSSGSSSGDHGVVRNVGTDTNIHLDSDGGGGSRLVIGSDVTSVYVNAAAAAATAFTTPTQEEEVETTYLDYMANDNMTTEEWMAYACANIEKIPDDFLNMYLKPIIFAFGIIGIIVTMIVLSRKTMCTSTNCYLTALAVADLFCLIILTTRNIADRVASCAFHVSSERYIFLVMSVVFMDIFMNLTIGVTVMLAVERYIAICHPMQALTICRVKRARIIIVILTVISFVLRSPKFFELKIDVYNTAEGRKISVSYREAYDEKIYAYIVTGALVTILPFFCLLLLNIRLILEIRRLSRYLRYHVGADWRLRSEVSREEIKITMMLVSVVCVFFGCHMPYMIYSLLIATEYDTTKNATLTESGTLKNFKAVGQCLMALKSSCNFILYCWFSEKFWTTFKRIFCVHRCLPQETVRRPNGCNNNSRNLSHNASHNTAQNKPSCHVTREMTC